MTFLSTFWEFLEFEPKIINSIIVKGNPKKSGLQTDQGIKN